MSRTILFHHSMPHSNQLLHHLSFDDEFDNLQAELEYPLPREGRDRLESVRENSANNKTQYCTTSSTAHKRMNDDTYGKVIVEIDRKKLEFGCRIWIYQEV